MTGIKDIFLKYPNELKLHKLATVEKLRERINDDDKLVRETLYQLFKSVVLPSCTEVILVASLFKNVCYAHQESLMKPTGFYSSGMFLYSFFLQLVPKVLVLFYFIIFFSVEYGPVGQVN